MRTFRNILIGLVILAATSVGAEPIGDIISYQGKLTDANGNPVENKTHTVIFKIYENGTEKFSQTFDNINTLGGVFSVFLGGSVPLPNFDPGNEYKLGIAADGGTETTHQIASVPVAKIAEANVKKSGDTMTGDLRFGTTGDLQMNSHGIYDAYSVSTGVVEGTPAVFGGNITLRSSLDGGAVYIEDGPERSNRTVHVGSNLEVTGRGIFNGGVISDRKGDVVAVEGISVGTGVRGEGYRGVIGSTWGGVSIIAVVESTGTGDMFHGVHNGERRVRIDNTGKGFFNGGTQNYGADYADLVTVKGKSSEYQPGDVLVIGDSPSFRFRRSSTPYSKNVAGIYSTKPGVLGSKRGIEEPRDNEVPLALTGIVPCKVSCENGPIRMGDLLVTSRTPGYAMKGTDRSRMLGTVLGKALQPLNSGKGVIEVLVGQK